MLACSCELPQSFCQDCSVKRRHNAKRRTPEMNFLRLINGKTLPYEEAKKYFTNDAGELAKSLAICRRRQ